MPDFSEKALSRLREQVRDVMSEERFAHTLGVEQTVAEMAALYCPEKQQMLRAAALLHDCTKEYADAQTRAVLAREGIVLRPDEEQSPLIHHAITAALEIPRLYPAFADPELLDCVRWHTTGHAGMTLPEALLYLADVIEPTRKHAACVALRESFFAADLAAMTGEQRCAHLCDTLRRSLVGTRDHLMAKNAPVCADTLFAIEYLKLKTHL
ncbi:MAG: bis(5'-nucleosyl)-tetraphosphatase (symmetrical) YqeK [Clostridia bacterium]|nr:bis(5'-nucleosyl)-tetraphosphatase (symmetrical) YqeK [Clostridia bacterium]